MKKGLHALFSIPQIIIVIKMSNIRLLELPERRYKRALLNMLYKGNLGGIRGKRREEDIVEERE